MRIAHLNLALVGLVGLLALAAFLWSTPGLDTGTPVTRLDPAAVSEVRIERPGVAVQAFERLPDGWRMTAPQSAAADAERLDRLVQIAAAPSHRRLPAEAVDAAELGLAPPAITLILDHTRLELGDTEPVNRRRYLRVGRQVHLIDDRFAHLLWGAPRSLVAAPDAPP
jgi:hypothetical protein